MERGYDGSAGPECAKKKKNVEENTLHLSTILSKIIQISVIMIIFLQLDFVYH